MTNHRLRTLRIPIANRLGGIDNLPHLCLLTFRQINLPRLEVLHQPRGFGGTRDCDHALSGNPGECDLRECAALAGSEFLDLFDDTLVGIEVLTLEFGDWEYKVSTPRATAERPRK